MPEEYLFYRPSPVLTLSQISELRGVFQSLIKERAVTYAQIAEQIGVDPDALKSFTLGRSARPRGEFLRKMALNIRRLEPYIEDDDDRDSHSKHFKEARLKYKRLFLDIAGRDYYRPWYHQFVEFLGADNRAIEKHGALQNTYALYRVFGNGDKVLKSRFEVDAYHEDDMVQHFTVHHRLATRNDRVSKGMILLFSHRLIMLAKIGKDEGNFVIHAEPTGHDGMISGVMTVMRRDERIFATRILLVHLTNKNISIHNDYGIMSYEKASEELGYSINYINNQIGQYDLLEIIRA